MKEKLRIKIIGIGGSGGSSLRRLVSMNHDNFQLYAIDSCVNSLAVLRGTPKGFWNWNDNLITIGQSVAGGLGVRADPEAGRKTFLESMNEISRVLQEADAVILTAGLGGGISSGVTPEIAKLCNENGLKIAGVFTVPFVRENAKRKRNASESLNKMREYYDNISVIECDQIVDMKKYPECMQPGWNESWAKIWETIDRRRADEVIRLWDIIKDVHKSGQYE